MTVNERSMASSRPKENLVVSFALGNHQKKANAQAAAAVAEKRKDMTESMNN
jgi:hypothetical protein